MPGPSPLMDARVSEITFLQCLHRIRAFRRAPHQPGCAPGRILVSLYMLPVVRLRFRMDMLSPQSGIPFSSFPADALNPPRIEALELRPWRPVDTYHRKFWGPRLGFSHMDLVSHGPTSLLAFVYTLPPQHSNCSAEQRSIPQPRSWRPRKDLHDCTNFIQHPPSCISHPVR